MAARSQPDTPPRRAARSDGLRNRQQVLEAAADAFAVDGLGASVREIAGRAGVGMGTLYRHFPTKEDLLTEVVRGRLEALLLISQGLADQDDPAAALVRWMQAASDHVSHFTAVGPWIREALRDNPQLRPLHEQIRAEGDALLRAAQDADGAVATVTIDDLMGAIVALSAGPPDDPQRPRRLLALLVGGVVPPVPQRGSVR